MCTGVEFDNKHLCQRVATSVHRQLFRYLFGAMSLNAWAVASCWVLLQPTAEGGATRFPVLVDMQNDKNLPTGAIRGNLGQRVNLASPSERTLAKLFF